MWLRILALVLLLPAWASQTAYANSPVGVWLTDDSKGKVQITECGGGLCGQIVWLKEPYDEDGKPWTDGYNPDPALRRRKIIGLQTFRGLAPSGDNLWIGSIYSPEEGRTYDNVKLSLVDNRTLKLEGCRVMGLVCGQKYWTRSSHTPEPVVAAARRKAEPKPKAQQQAAAVPAPRAAPANPPRKPQQQAAVDESRLPQTGAISQPSGVSAVPPHQQRDAAPEAPRAVAALPETRAPRIEDDGTPYVVQVAARRSEQDARAAVDRLRREHPLLNDYEPLIQRADLGERGVWYRLRFGPLSSKTAAADFCEQLRAAGLPDCLVRRH